MDFLKKFLKRLRSTLIWWIVAAGFVFFDSIGGGVLADHYFGTQKAAKIVINNGYRNPKIIKVYRMPFVQLGNHCGLRVDVVYKFKVQTIDGKSITVEECHAWGGLFWNDLVTPL